LGDKMKKGGVHETQRSPVAVKVGKIDLNNAVQKMKKKKKTLIQTKEKKADSLIIVSKRAFNSLTQNSN
jgi:hypothetical protein